MAEHRIRVDVVDEDVLNGLSLGDEVEVLLRGTVKDLSAPREYSLCCGDSEDGETEKVPGDLGLEISSTRIRVRSNEFTELDMEED